MNMIRHEAEGLYGDAVVAGMLGQQVKVELAVGIAEVDFLSKISAMAYMMG